MPSLLQRASQRTLKREDQVTGAGRCQERVFGITEASSEAIEAFPAETEPFVPAKLAVAITATKAPAKTVRTKFVARLEEGVVIG
ncbi:MAG: hypothetical protein QM760_10550 [Nibricoccus sp.]